MYGLGIRLGFYLQWYGAILAAWIARGEVKGLRLANIFFSAATLLATVIQVAKGASLQVVEIYIILLFNFHSAVYLLPIFAYRFATKFNPRVDPTRFPRAPAPSRAFNELEILLTIMVMIFQSWFWGIKVRTLDNAVCDSYGFLFYKISLRAPWFRIFHSVVAALILCLLLYLILCSCRERRGGKKKHDNDDDDWSNR